MLAVVDTRYIWPFLAQGHLFDEMAYLYWNEASQWAEWLRGLLGKWQVNSLTYLELLVQYNFL